MEPMKTVHYWRLQAFGLNTAADICYSQAKMYQTLAHEARCPEARKLYQSWADGDLKRWKDIREQIAEAEMMIEALEKESPAI